MRAGFDHAKGDLIARLYADSRADTDWIRNIKKIFGDSKVVAASSHIYIYDFPFFFRTLIPSRVVYWIVAFIIGKIPLYGPNLVVRKTAWKKVREQICLDESRIHDDIDLSIHIEKYGKVVFLKTPLVGTSSRHVTQDPVTFFIEYPIRLLKMRVDHNGRQN